MTFKLDQHLDNDTFPVCSLPLCEALLMNDARYPWVILVPRRESISEIYQLDGADQLQLQKESSFVARALTDLVSADKMNVAALGNVVSQLHVHHVARFQHDESWPAPVWGKGESIPYRSDEKQLILSQLQQVFSLFQDGNDTAL